MILKSPTLATKVKSPSHLMKIHLLNAVTDLKSQNEELSERLLSKESDFLKLEEEFYRNKRELESIKAKEHLISDKIVNLKQNANLIYTLQISLFEFYDELKIRNNIKTEDVTSSSVFR